MPTTLEQVNQRINELLGNRNTLQANLSAAQSSLTQKQQLASQYSENLPVMKNRQDINRGKVLIRLSQDLAFSMEQALNLYKNLGQVTGQEYDDFDNFRHDFQSTVDESWNEINSYSEYDQGYFEGTIGNFQGYLENGLQNLESLYGQYASSSTFYEFIPKLIYHLRLLLIESRTLPGCQDCSFTPAWFVLAASVNLLQNIRNGLDQVRGNFDPATLDDLNHQIDGFQQDLWNMNDFSFEYPSRENTDSLLISLRSWIESFNALMQQKQDEYSGDPTLYDFFQSVIDPLSQVHQYASNLNLESFPPAEPEAYREYIYATFDLAIQHYQWQLENLLRLAQDNNMGMGSEPQITLVNLLQSKLAELPTKLFDLGKDYNDGLESIRDSQLSYLQSLEAEVNGFLLENLSIFSSNQQVQAFLFAGIEGMRLTHFRYLTEFVNVLEGVQMHAAQTQLPQLEQEIITLSSQVSSYSADLAEVNDQLEFYPQYQVQTFRGQLPMLLTPVRLETKFVHDAVASKYYLCVRIYPDQILINSHEAELSAQEILAGRKYWEDSLDNATWQGSAWKIHQLDSWKPLVLTYGANRAAWIVKAMQPTNYAAILATASNVSFPVTTFPNLTAKNGSWAKAATAYALPDKFVASLYKKNIDEHTVVEADSVQEKLFDKFKENRLGGFEDHVIQFQDQIRILTTEFITLVDQQFGEPITKDLHVGMDPASLENGLFKEKSGGIGQLEMGTELAWLTDFNAAVAKGMGIRFELSPEDYESGTFARLVVLGVRSQNTESDPAMQSVATLEQLFANHRYTDGLRIVPQGTPTNNTDSQASGFSVSDERDAETSFKTELEGPLFSTSANELEKTDGQRLSELLGISAGTFQNVRYGDSRDVSEAKAMNASLWPATGGYFMEEIMDPLFNLDGVEFASDFFTNFVQARGPLPAFCVGSQPYGILPTTRFSEWSDTSPVIYRQHLITTLKKLDFTWLERLNRVYHYPLMIVEGNRYLTELDTTNILTILGLDATSSEFYHRYALGPEFYGILKANDTTPPMLTPTGYRQYGGYDSPPYGQTIDNVLYSTFKNYADDLLIGLTSTENPRAFDFTFQEGFHKILHNFRDNPLPSEFLGDFIDVNPLSEKLGLSILGEVDGQQYNYIKWLTQASFDQIRREAFDELSTIPDKGPNSLLYRMLRQAMMLSYWDMATHPALGTPFQREREIELFNMKAQKDNSRWNLLYQHWNGMPAYEYLEAGFREGVGTGRRGMISQNPDSTTFSGYVNNLNYLESLPTARLERLLAEHLDLFSYRLDAWKTGLVTQRLEENRALPNGNGIYLGAYGWLENINRLGDNRDNSYLDTETGLRVDPDNMGFIHAPSLTHAATAAILRQGYKSRQYYYDSTMPESNRMAVNLSSERVRKAQSLLEGIKTGQSLGALLGYRFERGLYEKNLGRVVGAMRKIFPLNEALNEDPGQISAASETISTRNVLDGLKLVKAYRENDYPSQIDIDNLEVVFDQEENRNFLREIDKLADVVDAVSDLVTAESVYQSVQGNYEAANASLESIAKGKVPSAPEVIRTPRTGTSLTHRVVLQLGTEYSQGKWDDYNTAYNIPDSPLSSAEPALNNWIGRLLGDPGLIQASVSYTFSPAGLPSNSDSTTFTLAELQLQPLNVYYLLNEQALAPDTVFDSLVRRTLAQRLRVEKGYGEEVPLAMVLDYTYRPSTGRSVAEALTLISQLRNMLAGSRPVNAADLTFSPDHNPNLPASDGYRMQDIQDRMTAVQGAVLGLKNEFALANNTYSQTDLKNLLAKAVPFNIQEAIVGANLPSNVELLERVQMIEGLLNDRLDAAAEILGSSPTFAEYEKAFQALLGSGFKVIPLVTLAGPAATAVRDGLTYSPTLVSRIENGGPLAMEEWLQGAAVVRDKMDALEKLAFLHELYPSHAASPNLSLKPVQLPLRLNSSGQVEDNWVGAEYPNSYVPEGDKLSLVMIAPANFNPVTTEMAGLLIDEWNEIIPHRSETTAVAFHYDQPNTEAPQSLLLAVSPSVGGYWSWENLLGTVNETLDMAKKRVVDSDSLAYTHLAPLLPAIAAPVAEFATTITLDYKSTTGLEHYGEKVLKSTV